MIKHIESTINESAYLIFFPIVDPFLDLSLPQIKNLHLLYHTPPQTKPVNNYFVSPTSKAKSESVLTNIDVQKYIDTTCKKLGKTAAIMPFKPSAKIDLFCQKNNFLLVSNPRTLNLQFEDKINFAKICTKNKINTIPFFVDNLNQKNIDKAQSLFKTDKIVIQVKTGWAGNSTYLSDLALKTLPSESTVKFMPFIKGTTYIQNGCIYQKNMITSPVGIQLNNPQHSKNIFATTGRSWPSNLDQTSLNKIKAINDQLETIFVNSNYRGFFGLDFLIDQNDNVYLTECNPRLTASFNFYTHLELKNNIVPLLYLHLLEFLNLNINLDIRDLKSRFLNQKLTGTQITKRNDQGKIVDTLETC